MKTIKYFNKAFISYSFPGYYYGFFFFFLKVGLYCLTPRLRKAPGDTSAPISKGVCAGTLCIQDNI